MTYRGCMAHHNNHQIKNQPSKNQQDFTGIGSNIISYFNQENYSSLFTWISDIVWLTVLYSLLGGE